MTDSTPRRNLFVLVGIPTAVFGFTFWLFVARSGVPIDGKILGSTCLLFGVLSPALVCSVSRLGWKRKLQISGALVSGSMFLYDSLIGEVITKFDAFQIIRTYPSTYLIGLLTLTTVAALTGWFSRLVARKADFHTGISR